MVKGNGFAPRRIAALTPQAPRRQNDWSMFMKRTVQITAMLFLRGQTTFAFLPEKYKSGLQTFLLALSFSLLAPQFTSLQAQCTLICHNDITVALDAAGQAEVFPPMLLQSSVGCSSNFDISVLDTLGNQHSTILVDSLVGMPLTGILTHPASGNSCVVEIDLIDATPPNLSCLDTVFVWCNEPLDSLDHPIVSDNATETDSIVVTFNDVFTDLNCFDSIDNQAVTAYTERTWSAMDESGNTAFCTQHIYLKRAVLSQIVFPKHRDGMVMPVLECGADDPNDFNITGQPIVDGLPVDIAGNCELIVSHTDQNVPICGGAERVVRTWTAFDLCTNGFLVFSQILRFEDHTPPSITCPDNVSFTTYNSACSAQVYLPQGTGEDDCSGVIVMPSWSFGNGHGPFSDIPAGIHTVVYSAEDGCNNISTCEIIVTVEDNKNPTAICENGVEVTLEADGTALIFAETFDNGSYDNCGIGEYLVERNGTGYSDIFASFDCADLMKNDIEVTLTVVDVNGLESTCLTDVTVIDEIKPEIICPAISNIGCGWDYDNTEITGTPYATDNCSVTDVSKVDFIDLNNCGNGTVERTWRATDQDGNVGECMQLIAIADDTDIDVAFPDDKDIYECQPNLDISLMGEPVITGQDCEQLQITYTDYYFYTAEPSCFQLIRNWAVVDWCTYTPNNLSGGGFWEHTQFIEVRDSIAPVLTCPDDMEVGIQNAGCETFVNVPMPEVDDCSNQLVFQNNSAYSLTSNGPASGIYPKGLHNVTYSVYDGCGNMSECSMRLNITDTDAPTPVCNNGISVTIQQTGYVTLTPANINTASFDNCTPTSSLILQVSPNTFTCQDLGTKVVSLTVTDESGNSAFCQTNVVVQDNFDVCGNGLVGVIAGKLETESGEALRQKLIGLSGGISMAVQTDVDGTFDFPSLPLNQSYTLTPTYNVNIMNGVTTYDLVFIRRHILGVQALGTPYKMIAADANKSGTVTTYDMVVLQKLILGVTTELPNGNTSWRFVDADYVFPNPANPWVEIFPEIIQIANLGSNIFNQNFVGIKVGDINGSADPSDINSEENEDRNADKELIIRTKDINLVAGQTLAIPFGAASSQSLAGFQFTLVFDENILEFNGYENGVVPSLQDNNFGTRFTDDGMLTMSWDNDVDIETSEGDVLFTLQFLIKNEARLSEALELNSRLTPAEAYIGDFDEINGLEVADVSLQFEIPFEETIQLLQNTPNPFFENTDLHFYLPEAASATINIYDVFGRTIKTYTQDFSAGPHVFPITLEGIKTGQLLICELDADGFQRQTIRMSVGN